MSDAPDWEGFARDLMQDWPVGDVDGFELFEAALRNGLLRKIPGGYDPEQHIDAEGICPKTGDPWYEYAFAHTRADLPLTDAQLLADNRIVSLFKAAILNAQLRAFERRQIDTPDEITENALAALKEQDDG